LGTLVFLVFIRELTLDPKGVNRGTMVTSYDEVPYLSMPFVETHPDRLATVATMFGMTPAPPPVATCRLLELGCAAGENLLALALTHPAAEFHGLDLSQRHVASARAASARLGLSNVHVQQLDILDFPADIEPFDFIVVHGVYSWVPAKVRDMILHICRQHLQPNGVAYISYNVYPGWRLRGIIRDILLYHVRQIVEPQERIRQALTLLQFMAEAVPLDVPTHQVFRQALTYLQTQDSLAQLYHDYLEPVNEPVYFHEFAAHAARHDLQFLAEADVEEMQTSRFPADVAAVLDGFGDDVLQREQYLDFLKNRAFRRTLLCHREVQVDRHLRPERLTNMYLAVEVDCEEPLTGSEAAQPLEFRSRRGISGTTDHALTQAALRHLGAIWPQCVLFPSLVAAAAAGCARNGPGGLPASTTAHDLSQLAENLLQLYAGGMLELHVAPPPIASCVSARPVASPWSRFQIEQGRTVTNLRHQRVQMEPLARRLVWLLDGTRDRPQLLDELAEWVAREGLTLPESSAPPGSPRPTAGAAIREILSQTLEDALQTVAYSSLLIAEP
jgi:methyltransferase-like protein/2-polyprenyl-3-methyl-5-hydroxy-6-metoxy-1,4-benzoquinol methylase